MADTLQVGHKPNLLSRFTFWWVKDVLIKDAGKELEHDFMPFPLSVDSPKEFGDKAERSEIKSCKISVCTSHDECVPFEY
ncbi:Protein of unknown function [Gryllus bimaculatus]|nr:Protein of unknown function [Gryllus bimaculatus]